jgi:hypothetical protein
MPTPEQLSLMVCECQEMARVLGDSPVALLWLDMADSLAEIARMLAGGADTIGKLH